VLPSASMRGAAAFVKASNPDPQDFFGGGVAITGNTLVAGATSEDSCATGINGNQSDNSCGPLPNGAENMQDPAPGGSGAVYVYGLQ
jgi:hypothetical protein